MGKWSIASCTRRSVVYLGLAISSRGPGRRPLTAIRGVPSTRLTLKTKSLGRMQWGVVGRNRIEFNAILSAILSRPERRKPPRYFGTDDCGEQTESPPFRSALRPEQTDTTGAARANVGECEI